MRVIAYVRSASHATCFSDKQLLIATHYQRSVCCSITNRGVRAAYLLWESAGVGLVHVGAQVLSRADGNFLHTLGRQGRFGVLVTVCVACTCGVCGWRVHVHVRVRVRVHVHVHVCVCVCVCV